MFILWRCKSTPTRKAKLLRSTVVRSITEIPFHLIGLAHCVSGGDFFIWNYSTWHSLHSGIISDPQAITAWLHTHLRTKFEFCNCIHSTYMKGCQKFEMMILCHEPKMNRLRHTIEDYYCAKFQIITIRSFRFMIFYHASWPTHIHTHRDKVIAISGRSTTTLLWSHSTMIPGMLDFVVWSSLWPTNSQHGTDQVLLQPRLL